MCNLTRRVVVRTCARVPMCHTLMCVQCAHASMRVFGMLLDWWGMGGGDAWTRVYVCMCFILQGLCTWTKKEEAAGRYKEGQTRVEQ